MALPTTVFYDIKEQNAALVDASSIVELCSHLTFFRLTTPFRKWRHPALLDQVVEKAQNKEFHNERELSGRIFDSWEEYSIARSLSLLERLCAHELLVVDKVALESLRGPEFDFEKLNRFSDLIYLTTIPNETYVTVGNSLRNYAKRMGESCNYSFMDSEHSRFSAMMLTKTITKLLK